MYPLPYYYATQQGKGTLAQQLRLGIETYTAQFKTGWNILCEFQLHFIPDLATSPDLYTSLIFGLGIRLSLFGWFRRPALEFVGWHRDYGWAKNSTACFSFSAMASSTSSSDMFSASTSLTMPVHDASITPEDKGRNPAPQDGNSKNRAAQMNACAMCRKRKIKCDGLTPSCGRCTRLKLDCAYEENRRKSGPRRGYVKGLQTRLGSMPLQPLTSWYFEMLIMLSVCSTSRRIAKKARVNRISNSI